MLGKAGKVVLEVAGREVVITNPEKTFFPQAGRFPSGRTAREIVVRDAAQLLWIVNLGCLDLNPHPVCAADLEHPDELRVDLDPGSGVSWDEVRRVTLLVRDVLSVGNIKGPIGAPGGAG